MTTVENPTASEAPWKPYTATLSASPFRAEIGETVMLKGEGFSPGAPVEFGWYSVEGRYEAQGVWDCEFVGQRFERTMTVVATATADEDGMVRASFEAPLDFGGPHDIRAIVAGDEVAQAGVSVVPRWSMTPAEGPVGTPVELRIEGIDIRNTISTWQLLWDNHYFGMMTGVTTRGVGVARFRAAGPVGVHRISAWNNSHQTAPYLGWDWCPYQDEFPAGVDFVFTVTSDDGPPEASQDDFSATDNPVPPEHAVPGRVMLSTDRGFIGSKVTVEGEGLPPESRLSLIWSTVTGAGILTPYGGTKDWRRPVGEVRTNAEGRLRFEFTIPEDLGGDHRIELCRGSETLAVAGFVIVPELVSYTKRARAGEPIIVHLRGSGLRDYDKTYGVTYDNSYIGYSCGGSNAGNVRFRFTASGAPGTHLVDLYPMIYRGRDEQPRGVYAMPHLSYADDHPLRRIPAFRLAVEVEEA